jgi:regulatory protein
MSAEATTPSARRRSQRADRERAHARPLDASRLKEAAHRYLERYDTTRAHLRQVLRAKIHKNLELHPAQATAGAALYAEVDPLVAQLAAMGLVDDRRYGEITARRMRRRGASAAKVRAKLAARGIDASLINEVLASSEDGDAQTADLVAACATMRRRRFGPYRAPCDDPHEQSARRRKELAALGRAGFSFAVAERVLAQTSPQAAEELSRQARDQASQERPIEG